VRKMEGYIDEYGQARVDVNVIGRKMQIAMDPIIDTGFDGDLSLPLPMAICEIPKEFLINHDSCWNRHLQLGLELSGSVEVELVDGSIKQELIFSGSTKLGEKTKNVEITLTESKDALLGTNMFSKLEIDFDGNKVVIR